MTAVTTKSDTPAYAAPSLANRAARLLLLLVLLVLGLAVGTVGSFLHRAAFSTGPVDFCVYRLITCVGVGGVFGFVEDRLLNVLDLPDCRRED